MTVLRFGAVKIAIGLVATLLLFAACGDDSTEMDLAVMVRDLSVPDEAAFVCDVLKQDCPMGQKCTYASEQAPFLPFCASVAGNVGAGQACSPISDSDAFFTIGMDDCQKGLICLSRPQGLQCHKFCGMDSECGTLAFCSHASLCEASCTLLGTDCPGGYSCKALLSNSIGVDQLQCANDGATAVGGACTTSSECAANTVCYGTPKQCRPVCNDTHACASGSCTPLMILGGNQPIPTLGYCM